MMTTGEMFRTVLWWVIDFAFGPIAPDSPVTVNEITVGVTPMKKAQHKTQAKGMDAPMATAPNQLRRCAECGELSRLYEVDGRHVCASCARKEAKK
jgi:hypothetical protein